MQEALNLSADLLVRYPLVPHSSLTRFGLHLRNTLSRISLPAHPGSSPHAIAGHTRGFSWSPEKHGFSPIYFSSGEDLNLTEEKILVNTVLSVERLRISRMNAVRRAA
jgi:hypothetical protein